jgi:hypothetical protein
MQYLYISTIKAVRGLRFLCLIFVILIAGCKKFVEVPLPTDSFAGALAYSSDKSTASVLNNIFGTLVGGNNFAGGQSVGYTTGLYTDELQLTSTVNTTNNAFYANALIPNQPAPFYTSFYKTLYLANAAIEGTRASETLRNKNQWLGEALFLRAFLNFQLVNLFGDVALSISSDYRINNKLSRSPVSDVNKQIIADLLEAQSLLSADFHDGSGEVTTDRTRPNKWAATALLARVYLYTGDWAKAETQASSLINNTSFKLLPLDEVFLANSEETIWSLAYTAPGYNRDFSNYNNNVPDPFTGALGARVTGVLTPDMVAAFESGDTRRANWVKKVTAADAPFAISYLVTKYKTSVSGVENLTVLRQSEQYLIRAEARARLNNLTGAKADLDAIRTRAGLGGVTAGSQPDMITAVMHERRVELFTEAGHRFFDLRRTGLLDATMKVAAPLKQTQWDSFRQYWPIPLQEMLTNPNLKQTPGY